MQISLNTKSFFHNKQIQQNYPNLFFVHGFYRMRELPLVESTKHLSFQLMVRLHLHAPQINIV